MIVNSQSIRSCPKIWIHRTSVRILHQRIEGENLRRLIPLYTDWILSSRPRREPRAKMNGTEVQTGTSLYQFVELRKLIRNHSFKSSGDIHQSRLRNLQSEIIRQLRGNQFSRLCLLSHLPAAQLHNNFERSASGTFAIEQQRLSAPVAHWPDETCGC